MVLACPLCALTQHLDRPEIDREAEVIWLPTMTQAVVNVLVRQIHLGLRTEGHNPKLALGLRGEPPSFAVRRLRTAYLTLHERAEAAALRLGTSSPRQLGAALMEFSRADYERRDVLLAGARLLPLGALYRHDRDIYPEILDSWASLSASPVKETAA